MNGSKTKAWIGAILVHIALLAVLFFSVRWKQVAPAAEETLAVELVSTVAAPRVVAEPAPQPAPAPAPTPAPAPEPPAPAPKPAPKPAPPKPAPPPPPPAVKAPAPPPVVKAPAPAPPPAPSPADIAREKAQNEALKRAQLAKLAADEAKQNMKLNANEEAAKKEATRKLDEARAKEIKLSQDKANKEQQTSNAAAAAAAQAAEKQAKELAERQAAERAARAATDAAKTATDAATARARAKSEGDYVSKIRAKVKGNIILAIDVAGNPEAVFDVVQLPTGEVLSVRLTKSSGNRAYDEAVERAINKSSPLPKPDQADVFQRQLSLKFRPLE